MRKGAVAVLGEYLVLLSSTHAVAIPLPSLRTDYAAACWVCTVDGQGFCEVTVTNNLQFMVTMARSSI